MSINRINTLRLFEVNSSIVEWDIRRAGINLIKTFSLLPKQKIEKLSMMEKREADKKIGIMQINDREFSKSLEQAFTDIMNDFLKENSLDMDWDVLSIKKDACFVINRRIQKSSFGEYIEFIPKNTYHAYMYLKPYEFYWTQDTLTLKNMTSDKDKREKIIQLHENGILNLLDNAVHIAEVSGMNRIKLNRFLHEFVELYKKRELDFDYYREFNVQSGYRYKVLNSETIFEWITEEMFKNVDISYNYKNIILPLINILC